MEDPPVVPENPDHGATPRPATRRPRRRRVVTIVAIVLLLLFVAVQLDAGASRSGGGRTASSAPAKSHLGEARGHLDAILHLFD